MLAHIIPKVSSEFRELVTVTIYAAIIVIIITIVIICCHSRNTACIVYERQLVALEF